MTLAILQRLYERHKVLTYPRTDSRALPEDYPETMKETLSHLQKLEAYNAFAGQILMSGWVKEIIVGSLIIRKSATTLPSCQLVNFLKILKKQNRKYMT